MKRLPIVKVPCRYLPNPYWVRETDVNGVCTNIAGYYLPETMVEAEVLTLNLNSGNMRVRLLEKVVTDSHPKGQVVSFDVSNEYFFNAFDIVGKGI